MASNIDPLIPPEGDADTAGVRGNFQAAKDEIEALQALPSSGISAGDISNWNTAYGWGNHASAGYLTDAPADGTAYGRLDGAWTNVLTVETDPVFNASPAGGITADDITNWNAAYGWGDHAGLYDSAGSAAAVQANLDTHIGDGNPHLSADERNAMTAANAPSDINPIATINDISTQVSHIIQDEGIDITNAPRLNFTGAGVTATSDGTVIDVTIPGGAAGSGDVVGPDGGVAADELAVYGDTTGKLIAGSGITLADLNIANWDTAYGWGDHSAAGYLTAETDPVFSASPAAGIVADDITNWDTAFGWGNHASAGYALASDLTAHTGDTSNPHAVTAAQTGAEPALGNPAADGYVLSSLADGTRSWVAPGAPDLTDAVFPTYAGFDAVVDGGASAIDFATGNLQSAPATAGDLVLTGPTPGIYILIVPDSTTITSVTDSAGGTVEWIGGAPTFSGKAVIACLFDGTNWILDYAGDVA